MNQNINTAQSTLYFTLIKEHWLPGAAEPVKSNKNQSPFKQADSHTALFVHSGGLLINDKPLKAGNGACLQTNDTLKNISTSDTTTLRFVVSKREAPDLTQCIMCQSFTTNLQQAFLRLDQVDFPPGAIAYRHTHPGAGIRYLLNGSLQLESEHGVQHFKSEQAWFEESNSPVQATAIDSEPSCFIRAMLLPTEFEGKSTLTLLNPEDKQKPRLQTNLRHDEQLVLISH